MRKIFPLAILAVLLSLTGCSPYTLVSSEVYNNANLAQYHTFRLVTPADGKLPPGMEMVTYYNIAAAIREQLVERGFTEDPQSPLLVNIGLTVKKDLVTTPVTQFVPTGPAWGPLPAPPPLPRPGGPVGPPPVANGVTPYFMYPRSYYWPENYTTVTNYVTNLYREGVLTIDFVDIKKMEPVYSASVATILDNGDSQLRNLSGIADAVKVLFSKFPIPLEVNRK